MPPRSKVGESLWRAWSRVNKVGFGIALLGLIYLAFNLSTLLVYPPAESDEGLYSSQAFTLLTQGKPGVPGMGNWYGASENFVQTGRVYLVSLALVFKMIGVSLLSARLFSFLGGVVAVYWTYRLGGELYGRPVGVGAAIVLATAQPMFFSSHYARMDVWVGAAVPFAAYWFVCKRNQGSSIGVLAIGFMTAILLDIHWNGFYFVIGFGVAWIIQNFGQANFLASLSKYVVGASLGGLYWGIVHFLPDPLTAWSQVTKGFAEHGLIQQTTDYVANLKNQFEMWWRLYVASRNGLGLVEITYSLVGLGIALKERTKSDVFLLLVMLGATISFSLLSVPKVSHYRIAWEPLVAVLVSRAVLDLGKVAQDRWRMNRPVLITGIILAPLLVASVAANVYLAYRFRNYSYSSEIRTIQSWILPNSAMIGPSKYWYAFRENDYRGSDNAILPFADSTYRFSYVTAEDTLPYLLQFVSGLQKHGVKSLSIIDWAGPCSGTMQCFDLGYLKQFESQWCVVRGTFNSYSSQLPRLVAVHVCRSDDNWRSTTVQPINMDGARP